MNWWRHIRHELRDTFPDTEIRILPRPGVGPDALLIRLGADAFLVDRQGILTGPQNDTFSFAYAKLLVAFDDRDPDEKDPSIEF